MAYYGQLLWEEDYISMPFLLEHLPFLAEFNGPEVSIHEILYILANPPSTTIAAPVVDHQTNDSVHGTNQHIYGRNQHMYGSNQPIPSINMDSVPLQTNQTVQPSNIASASIQANNTITSYRNSCETCRVRKIKCFPVAGTGPRTCEFCQEKGHKCEFKEKKPYVRTKP